jgi:hypothetical protein
MTDSKLSLVEEKVFKQLKLEIDSINKFCFNKLDKSVFYMSDDEETFETKKKNLRTNYLCCKEELKELLLIINSKVIDYGVILPKEMMDDIPSLLDEIIDVFEEFIRMQSRLLKINRYIVLWEINNSI